MRQARMASAKLMGSDLVKPLSPVARVVFVIVAAGMTTAAVVLFAVSASSTAGLIFVVLPCYAALAYGLIFVIDFAVRRGGRAIRR